MSAVVIGMDPHKRSATIEVMDQRRGCTLFAGYLVVLITYDLSARRRSRKKSKSGHAAELS